MTETICETPRLAIRKVTRADAPFLFRQVNEPLWLANIGDRGVRSLADAETYIDERILAQYRDHGFGMYLVQLKAGGAAVGVCGLVKRETLPHPDLGFALLEEHFGQGYGAEAAAAVMRHALDVLKLPVLLAIVTPANMRSCRLLEKLGFTRQGTTRLEPGGDALVLYEARRGG